MGGSGGVKGNSLVAGGRFGKVGERGKGPVVIHRQGRGSRMGYAKFIPYPNRNRVGAKSKRSNGRCRHDKDRAVVVVVLSVVVDFPFPFRDLIPAALIRVVRGAAVQGDAAAQVAGIGPAGAGYRGLVALVHRGGAGDHIRLCRTVIVGHPQGRGICTEGRISVLYRRAGGIRRKGTARIIEVPLIQDDGTVGPAVGGSGGVKGNGLVAGCRFGVVGE